MQIASRFSPLAFIDLLIWLADDGGCCVIVILAVIAIVTILIGRSNSQNGQVCASCNHRNQKGATFCSKCGDALQRLKTPKSFYPNFKLRIENWRKWGWTTEADHRLLEQLKESDELVFQGRKPDSLAFVFNPNREGPQDHSWEVEEHQAKPSELSEEATDTSVVVGSDRDSEQLQDPQPSLPKPVEVQPVVARIVKSESVESPEPAEIPVVSGPSVQPAQATQPPRKLSDLLRAFMDANNIKLGEFVAGLLIVIGSVGLVTALNATFKDIPYLPSVVFLTIVSLFHIAGIYSFKKWNLTSSSKVVLLIGNLLIPLNVLMTTMGDTSLQQHHVYFVLAVIIASASFGAMSYFSAKVLSPERPWPLIIGLLGPCLCQLVVKLYMNISGYGATVWSTNLLVLLPIAFVSFAVLSEHRYFRKQVGISTNDAIVFLKVLGVSLFSLGSCIALLFHRIESAKLAIELSQYLSNPLMIVCFIIVSSGMLIYRRISPEEHLKLRMTGMWMAVTGTLGIVLSMLLAVPHLDSMIVASFVGAGLALIFGYVTRITFLTAAGTLCFGLGMWSVYLRIQFGMHSESLTSLQLRDALGDGMTSVLFTTTAIAAAVLHYLFATVENRDRPEFSRAGYLGVLLLAAVGFLSAIVSHLPMLDGQNSDLTLGVFTIYAVAALAASTLSVQRRVHLAAAILTMIASLKLANTHFVEDWGWLPSVDALGRLSVLCWTMLTSYVLTAVIQRIVTERKISLPISNSMTEVDLDSAQFAYNLKLSIVTILFVLTAMLQFFHVYLYLGAYSTAVGQGILLTLIAVLLALAHRTDWTWMVAQIQTMAAVSAVVTLIYSNSIEAVEEFRFWTWSHLKIHMIVLSIGMLAWTAIRKVCQQSERARQWIVTDLMYFDFVLHALATLVIYVIWVLSLVGPLSQIYPDSAFLDHVLAFYGSSDRFITMTDWSLWIVNLMAWIAVIPDRHRRISSFCGLLTLSALPILVSTSLTATAGGDGVALIHYLKWGYGLFGVIVAGLVCSDRFWWQALQNKFPRLMANQDEKSEGFHAEHTWMALRIVSFIAASLPVVALTAAHFIYTSSVAGIGTSMNEMVLLQSQDAGLSRAMWNFGGPFFLLVFAAWICATRSLRPFYLVVALPMWLLGWMFFDLINVWSDGEDLTVAAGFGTFKWGLLGLGIYGLTWAGFGLKTTHSNLKQLFAKSSASAFVYAVLTIAATLFMVASVFDAFIVIDAVDKSDQWQNGWRAAFSDWAAFGAAFVLPLACWAYDSQGTGRKKVSYVFILLLTLNANIAHLLVTEVPGTSVLFNQTIGWLAALLLAVGAFGYFARITSKHESCSEKRWEQIRANCSRWMAWVYGLSAMIFFSIWLFWGLYDARVVYTDTLLLLLMGMVVLALITFSHWIQDGVPNLISVLFAIPLIGLLAIKVSSLGMHEVAKILPDLGRVIEAQNQYIVRLVIGGFGCFTILGCLIQNACQRALQISPHKDQVSSLTRRGLLMITLIAYLIHCVIALLLVPEMPELKWVVFPGELVIVTVLILALYLNSRGLRFEAFVPFAYMLGVSCAATLLVHWYLSIEATPAYQYHFVILMSLAIYLGIWGIIYRHREYVSKGLQIIGVMDIHEIIASNRNLIARFQFWLGMLVTTLAMLSSFYLQQADDNIVWFRYWAALMPMLVIVGFEALRGSSLDNIRIRVSLCLILVSVTILLWAGLDETAISSEVAWFHRLARVFIAYTMVVTAVFFGRRKYYVEQWDSQIKAWLRTLLSVVSCLLLIVMLFELAFFVESKGRLSSIIFMGELVGISLGIIALGWMLFTMGLDPDDSPFESMSLSAQKGCVYFAEMMLFAFGGHIYFGKPEWFAILGSQWPFVIMALAFIGAIISEVCRQRETHVLSEPIHNTAFFLPAIPILTLWMFPTGGGALFNDYSQLFFGAAIINLLMASLRKSFLHSVVAAISGNASLWLYFTSSDSLSFVDDPQFWVIPPAVSMIIVAQIFKSQLTRSQLISIRYMSLTLVYLTASFDMIANWASNNHLQEMIILGVLSLLGVGFGALFRIPQFVYLGLVFLIMTLLSMVISVIYAGGELNEIALFVSVIGVGILILIALSARDKYQEKLKRWIDKIDSWE